MAARLMPHRIALCLTATAAYKRVLTIFYIRPQNTRPQPVTSVSGGRRAERGFRRIHEGSRPTHYHGWH